MLLFVTEFRRHEEEVWYRYKEYRVPTWWRKCASVLTESRHKIDHTSYRHNKT